MTVYESLVALPGGLPSDLYQEHQAVWRVAASVAANGSEFLYSVETAADANLVRLRSLGKLWGGARVALPPAGRLAVRMVCATWSGEIAIPVPDDAVDEWFVRRMARLGFDTGEVSASALRFTEGRKREHLIRIPVREIACSFVVADAIAASEAFRHGVGRAKRFGCGMLRVVDTDPVQVASKLPSHHASVLRTFCTPVKSDRGADSHCTQTAHTATVLKLRS